MEDRNPWTHLEFQNDDRNFHFAIVGDRRGGSRTDGAFRTAVDRLNLLRPAFVMSVGDLASCCTPGDPWGWNGFDTLVDRLEMPFFYVAGNADVGSAEATDEWRQRLGRGYYEFTYHDVLFIALNTEDIPGSPRGGHVGEVGVEQMDWLAQVLADNTDARWTFLFFHKPIWLHEQQEWLDIETLLANRPYMVFSGHHHRYGKYVRNGANYYTLASTGGMLPDDSLTFDHIVWIAMTDDGPKVSNLILEGVLGDAPSPDSIPSIMGGAP